MLKRPSGIPGGLFRSGVRALFVYGTLLDPRVQQRITGRDFWAVPARLPGFVRYRVVGAAYPGIRPGVGAVVEGALLLSVGEAAFRSLDVYEGPLYRRERHNVQLPSGRMCRAFVYVVRSSRRHRLSLRD
ncbi:MAG: gamma-glutamylcyclotransferase [Gammaproteobacteria bacterium]|nr:gamma-glutamylcyclotransferase [Gammaproteobacteria bacterium]